MVCERFWRLICNDEFLALTLAMARDGSSGGIIRLAIIDKTGVEREFIPGDKLPRNYYDQ